MVSSSHAKARGGKKASPARDEQIMSAVVALAKRCNYEEGHTHQVTRLAVRLFDELNALHHLGPAEQLYLRCAGMLHDIGWSEGKKGHHKTAQRLILQADELPMDARVRKIVALVARYHRKALPSAEHEEFASLSERDQLLVRQLAAILRVADGLDVMHQNMVQDVRCRITAGDVTITYAATGPMDEGLAAATEKADLFEQVFGRKIVFKAAVSA